MLFDSVVDREENYYSESRTELIEHPENRFTLSMSRDGVSTGQWSGWIAAWDAQRGVSKLLFENTGLAFVRHQAEGNRFSQYDDNYNSQPILIPKIDPALPAQWDMFLSYFCTALGAAENRAIHPEPQPWNFTPWPYDPWYASAVFEGNSWRGAFDSGVADCMRYSVDLGMGYLVNCYWRMKGQVPIVLLTLEAPGIVTQVSLYLRTFHNMPSQLCIHNALGDIDRINTALDAWTKAHDRQIR
jgi:hypothetical protein